MLGDGELSDGERRRLAEIESSLRTNDPGFVQRFEERRLRRRRHRRNLAALLAVSAAVIVVVVALARHSVVSAVLGLVAIGATAGIWATACRRT
jgi:Flp pilus assembly protein TadB